MRVYRRQTQLYSATAWSYPTPTAAVAIRTTAGAPVEALAASYNATYRRLYFDSTNALYVHSTLYLAYWTITVGGVVYALTAPQAFVHYTPAAGAATGEPTIGLSTVGDTSVIFTNTPPSDAYYDTTIIYAYPVYGGTVVTGSGSGATITVSGLQASTLYDFVPEACNASGVGTMGKPVLEKTLPSNVPAFPLWVKWWVSGEDDMHENSPEAIDAMQRGSHTVRRLGRGRSLRIRLESHAPIPSLSVLGIGVYFVSRAGDPAGQRNEYGN